MNTNKMVSAHRRPIKNPKVVLVYPPNQSWPGTMCKPNGSLAYPNIGAALLEIGIEVEVFDAAVGNHRDDLKETFYQQDLLSSGLLKTGVSDERILQETAEADIVGLTSIFTEQETMVLSTARLIKEAYPSKLIVAGGVNARSRMTKFFASGVDIVCLSEAESAITKIVLEVRKGTRDFGKIPGIAYQQDGKLGFNPATHEDVVWDLDELPMPAWHLLPNDRYWEIGRPHGGHFEHGETLAYASIMTSLGCVFACEYCHIAGETENSASGPIGRFRVKSDDRVLAELAELKRLGVKQVFVEDDTIFGMKRRAINLLRKIRGAGFNILDVNGVNLIHLFKKFEPDAEVIEALMEAGFSEIVLPFESGSQRVIKKYATNKWDVENHDTIGLLKLCKEYGLTVPGNFMIGYPDETLEEINNTLDMARKLREAGLDSANMFLVMPLPGTPLFDMAIREGYLPRDFNPDKMNWAKANMTNTPVPPEQLEEMRDKAWEELNDSAFVSYKQDMVVEA